MNEPPAFRNPELPPAERVRDLLGRLTLEEKIGLLHQYQAPVERLGLGPFRTGTEALHGLAWNGPATVFPQAIGLASTWNPELVRQVGAATGDEVIAFHHKDPEAVGRNVWAPVVNPLRDPRWGRNEEGYSEDPWLTGIMGTAYARGLRGDAGPDGRGVLKTAPTLKHFLAYNNETDRCVTSSVLSPRVLHEYELKAYRPAIETGAAVAVMPSYNLVNGRPAHLSPLIESALRTWAHDDILVVSDAYAPANLTGLQAYHKDLPEAYAHAIKAGLDSFTQDDADPAATLGHIRTALDRGLLTEGDIDRAARHVLSIRVRLGEFDPATPYDEITQEVVNSPEHRRLAREAARQSITLLKNDGILPLGSRSPAGSERTVAVIGPLADVVLEDWYSGSLPYQVTAREALAERCEVVHCEGVDRVALRTEGGYLVAVPDAAGGPLRVGPDKLGPDKFGLKKSGTGAHGLSDLFGAFDVFDWGGDALAFRAAANGLHLSVQDDGVLVNDQPGPNGWEVRQTFRMEERPRGVVLRHISTGHYVTVEDGVARIAEDPDAAAVLSVELIDAGAARAAEVAAAADIAIVVLGDHPLVNGRETEDRTDLSLPARQEAVLRAVHAANPATVLVISSGYPFAVTWADEHVPAIVWSAHGGQEYGHALADVLFGDEDPGGRLTQTWYRSAADLPDLLDYDIITAEATYLYYRGMPLYPFGHGLSYAHFEYSDLMLSAAEVAASETLAVTVTVTNTGTRAGEEVVQVYTHQQRSRVKQPVAQLRGFRRVRLEPGESRTVSVEIPVGELEFWDVTRGRFVLEDAPHKVRVGRSSRDIRLCAPFRVKGETIPPRALTAPDGPDPITGPVTGPVVLSAADHDEYDAVVLCDAAIEAGDAVQATEAGAWIVFRGADFGRSGGGPTGGTLSVSSAEGGVLTLRLDDPLCGEAIGAVTVPPTATRHDFVEVDTPLAQAAGVRDLYVVFESEGVVVNTLEFAP